MKIIGVLALLMLVACSSPSAPAVVNGEKIPPGEAAAIASSLASFHAIVEAEFAAGVRPAPRDAHAKGQGCVKAIVRIASDLPAELQHGVFAKVQTFHAWIRMSNGAPVRQADRVPDGRGMAIKLVGVDGPKLIPDEAHTQDFVMINNPVFFSPDAQSYAQLASALLHKKGTAFLEKHPAVAAIIFATSAHKVNNLFAQRYFSMSPYLLGSTYVKYSTRPAPCPIPNHLGAVPTDSKDPDSLRAQMVADLHRGDVCFELQLQPRTDPQTMLIESASSLWDESKAPFIDAAFITIPKQTFDSPAQQKFCEENLAFTPWHSTTDFRPVGGINRLRLPIYRAGQQLRQSLNHAKPIEPTGNETF